ncbi:RDD family protein [Aquimarina brevivitae]|uniref:Putative RDD family membrane protein YckC n=1 Tax=Aquimarina brevivitae TaxID=323412 RepID=A0A4Q7P1S5_9FLAO|nr:RDD family protein [Aquimarina brevivitae]RZS93330.1 putative RDD family membrane protein YckC [Aquimarina brevivitae]
MANIAINTTQNVNLDYKIVSIGERIVAFLIDFGIFWLYFFIVNLITSVVGTAFSDTWTVIGVQSLLLVPIMFYSLYMHIIFNGRTVGKMIMKMRVVRTDGLPVHWSNYMVRWMLRLVDIWIFTGSIGILTILFSDKKQRLGDAAAGTIVISTKNKVKISHTILEEVGEDYQPKFTSVTSLSDKDVRLIKETYQIAKSSRDYKMLTALRQKVEQLLETNSELYDIQYIDTVLKDYNYFTQQF